MKRGATSIRFGLTAKPLRRTCRYSRAVSGAPVTAYRADCLSETRSGRYSPAFCRLLPPTEGSLRACAPDTLSHPCVRSIIVKPSRSCQAFLSYLPSRCAEEKRSFGVPGYSLQDDVFFAMLWYRIGSGGGGTVAKADAKPAEAGFRAHVAPYARRAGARAFPYLLPLSLGHHGASGDR